MKKPSANIPEDLKNKDEILDGVVEILDDAYVRLYDELLQTTNWVDYSTLPDKLLDYALFENGLAIFDGYTATQKRSLLSNIVEIDTKRYTKEGLALFVTSILPNFYVDVEVPYQLNELSFRNPAVGFPNSSMRETAGRDRGDVNPYIFNKDQQDSINVILFAPSDTEEMKYEDEEFFNFLDTVIPSQLPDLIPDVQFQVLKYAKHSEQVTVNGQTITGSTTTSFDVHFEVGGYIGLYSSSKDEVFAMEIDSITPSDGTSDDELTIDSSYDVEDLLNVSSGSTVEFYVPYGKVVLVSHS